MIGAEGGRQNNKDFYFKLALYENLILKRVNNWLADISVNGWIIVSGAQ